MQIVSEQNIGDFIVQVVFRENNQLALQWTSVNGKEYKTTPSTVKSKFPKELKRVQSAYQKDKKYLAKRRKEFDRSYIKKETWSVKSFLEKMVGNKLNLLLTSKMIWQIRTAKGLVSAIYVDGKWKNASGKNIKGTSDKDLVRLWHPVYSEMKEVIDWRNYISEREISQPIKQAFREIYILTQAEKNTKTYSNRMAAHILKQGQFQALARTRGWTSTAIIFDSDEGSANINLPAWEMQASYWISRADDEDDLAYAKYIATDQIRFERKGELLDLEVIPAVAFSEVMRDADLFVGVSSVGNDPTWNDTGPEGHRDYWTDYSFGELTQNAESRKAVLEKLVPKLKIANQSKIEGRFLEVKGKFRTYKIHMGSGNILMKPNDQYLCIVPDASKKKKTHLFLPFEGDHTLSVILSKAFMLADDDKIEDETIMSQIR